MSPELVIQCPLPTAPEGNQYPLAKNQRYWQPFDKFELFAEVAKPSEEFVRGANTF
jgi:hypothetical protein